MAPPLPVLPSLRLDSDAESTPTRLRPGGGDGDGDGRPLASRRACEWALYRPTRPSRRLDSDPTPTRLRPGLRLDSDSDSTPTRLRFDSDSDSRLRPRPDSGSDSTPIPIRASLRLDSNSDFDSTPTRLSARLDSDSIPTPTTTTRRRRRRPRRGRPRRGGQTSPQTIGLPPPSPCQSLPPLAQSHAPLAKCPSSPCSFWLEPASPLKFALAGFAGAAAPRRCAPWTCCSSPQAKREAGGLVSSPKLCAELSMPRPRPTRSPEIGAGGWPGGRRRRPRRLLPSSRSRASLRPRRLSPPSRSRMPLLRAALQRPGAAEANPSLSLCTRPETLQDAPKTEPRPTLLFSSRPR